MNTEQLIKENEGLKKILKTTKIQMENSNKILDEITQDFNIISDRMDKNYKELDKMYSENNKLKRENLKLKEEIIKLKAEIIKGNVRGLENED